MIAVIICCLTITVLIVIIREQKYFIEYHLETILVCTSVIAIMFVHNISIEKLFVIYNRNHHYNGILMNLNKSQNNYFVLEFKDIFDSLMDDLKQEQINGMETFRFLINFFN